MIDPTAKQSIRTHVVLPPELVAEVDRRVGPRRRSQFLTDAVVEKLARLRLAEAAGRAAGSLANVQTLGWESADAAASWVRSARRQDADKRANRLKT